MADIQEYKCPNCGGALAFDSTLQMLKCPYCDTELDVEALKAYDQDLESTSEQDKLEWESAGKVWQEGDTEGLRVYVCKSCGGQIIGDENTAATSCPYCGNPVVLMGQVAGDLKPDYIIPFKLDKEAAKKKLVEHYSSRPFVPKLFTSQNHIDEIKGIYVPYWLYDSTVEGTARYSATTVNTWSDMRNMYTETRYYSVVRQGTISFANIPEDASSKMPDEMMESLEPFDYSEAVDFQTAYMAGYLADRYDVSAEDNRTRADARIKVTTDSALASTVHGYMSVVPQACSVKSDKCVAKYAMLPVWLLNTSWNGQTYTFAMNGQTGKMVGDIPTDKKRIWGRFFMLTGIIGAAIFLVRLLLQLV